MLSTCHHTTVFDLGATQNVVILQLENEDFLTSIDIGNEFSALIEVLVSRSSEKNKMFSVIFLYDVFVDFLSPKC